MSIIKEKFDFINLMYYNKKICKLTCQINFKNSKIYKFSRIQQKFYDNYLNFKQNKVSKKNLFLKSFILFNSKTKSLTNFKQKMKEIRKLRLRILKNNSHNKKKKVLKSLLNQLNYLSSNNYKFLTQKNIKFLRFLIYSRNIFSHHKILKINSTINILKSFLHQINHKINHKFKSQFLFRMKSRSLTQIKYKYKKEYKKNRAMKSFIKFHKLSNYFINKSKALRKGNIKKFVKKLSQIKHFKKYPIPNIRASKLLRFHLRKKKKYRKFRRYFDRKVFKENQIYFINMFLIFPLV